MTKTRVLCVVGSESGTAKRGIQRIVDKHWKSKAKSFEVVDVVDGNKVSDLAKLREVCDVVLIATSSYGDGEAPDNFASFYNALVTASKSGDKPLNGLQHAVLGFGSTIYDTFQNCPRISDKMLGECGSRRLAMRAELDDLAEESHEEQAECIRWRDEVFKVLEKLPKPDAAPACDWSQPASQIKVHEEMGAAPMMIGAIFATIVAAGAAYYFVYSPA